MNLKNKIYTAILTLVIAMQPCFAITLSKIPILSKLPISNEMLFTAKKFILAMIGVVISSVLIFIVLTLYRRFFHNPKLNEKTTYNENTLEPAKNLDNAISNFLNRTKL